MTLFPPQSPYEIIAGPAEIYIAATGTAFPAVNADPGAGWTDLGMTEGGVHVQMSQTINNITTDQYTAPVKGVRSEESLVVSFSLAELTLDKFALALNNATVVSVAGPPATKEIPLYRGVPVARHSLLVRGPSPYGPWNMQWQIPAVMQTENPEVAYVKDDKSVLNVAWTTLIDLTAANDSDRFGKLIAQSA
jgi:hypothetical protein